MTMLLRICNVFLNRKNNLKLSTCKKSKDNNNLRSKYKNANKNIL